MSPTAALSPSRRTPPPPSQLSCQHRSGALSLTSLTPGNVAEMARAFLSGLRDSLLGVVHVFRLDAKADRRRAKKGEQAEARKDTLLSRATPPPPPTGGGSPATLAKRRAVERREQNLRRSTSSSSSSSSSSVVQKRRDEGTSSPNIKKRILICCTLNGFVYVLITQFFKLIVLPCCRAVHLAFYWYLLARTASPPINNVTDGEADGTDGDMLAQTALPKHEDGWGRNVDAVIGTFQSVALTFPLFVLCRSVNAILYQEIADTAFRQSRGRVKMMSSFSVMVSDVIISIVVEFLFLAQSNVCACIPFPTLARMLVLFHMSLLHSLYSFEYKWYNQGIGLHQRLSYIERNWPYFLGFGLPLALLTELCCSDFMTAGLVFSLLFPLFIVAGNQAHVAMSARDVTLLVFYPTVEASNLIFTAVRAVVAGPPQQQSKKTLEDVRKPSAEPSSPRNYKGSL